MRLQEILQPILLRVDTIHLFWKIRLIEKSIKETLDLMDAHVNTGKNPREMAEKVYEIINTKHPKIHYKVGGFMEKVSIFLKRILSDRVYEKLVMRHYKL